MKQKCHAEQGNHHAKMIRVPRYHFRCRTKTSTIGLHVANIIELLLARAKDKTKC